MLTTAPSNENAGLPRWLKILIWAAIIALSVSLVVRFITPNQVEPQPFATKNFDGSTSKISNITFDGDAPPLPAALPAGEATITYLNGSELEQQLVENFNLEQSEDDPTIWNSNEFSLNSADNMSRFNLSSNRSLPPSSTFNSLSELIREAKLIVDRAVPENNWQPRTDSVAYFTSDSFELAPATPKTATVIAIPFGNTFGDYEVFIGGSQSSPAVVWMEASGNLSKLSLRTELISVAQQRKYDVIPIGQAIQQIEDGNASIIDAREINFSRATIDVIKQAKFNTVVVEYRTDAETGQAIPYYRFSGEITNDQGQVLTADVITPAIQTGF